MSKNIKAGGAFVTLGVEDRLAAGLQKASARLKAFGGSAASLGAPLAAMSGGILAAAAAPTRLAAEFESAGIAFSTMLGDAGKAKKLMDDIVQLSAATPFQQDELIQASKSLLAFGSTAEEIPGQLTKIGDISSGVGAPISEIAEIFGKAKVAGTLFSEDINQLVGRGIPVIQEFAKQLAVPESAVKKMASEGKINFAMLETAFDSLTSTGGKFAGMMKAQSESTAGRFSTLQDNVSVALREIGQSMLPVANEVMSVVTRMLETFQPMIAQITPVVPVVLGVAAALGAVGTALLGLAGGSAALGWILGALAPVASLAVGIGAVSAAVWLLRDDLQPVFQWISEGFSWVAETATQAWGGIADALAAGDLALAGQIAMSGLKLAFTAGLESLAAVFGVSVGRMSEMVAQLWKQIAQAAAYLNNWRAEASNWLAERMGDMVGVDVQRGDSAALAAAEEFQNSVNAIDTSKLAENIGKALDPEQYRKEMESLIAKASEAKAAMGEAQQQTDLALPEVKRAQQQAQKALSEVAFNSVGSFSGRMLNQMMPGGKSTGEKQLDVQRAQLKAQQQTNEKLDNIQPATFGV